MNANPLPPMDIEKQRYHEFLAQWNAGLFRDQRFGQAFYSHFSLHRLSHQERLGSLYEAGEEEAKALIQRNFRFV